MIARVSLLVVSLLVVGWAGVLVRDERVGQAALHALRQRPGPPPARFAREIRRLESARLLNPDSKWDLYQGSSWLAHGRPDRANRVLEALVRREPDNLAAWGVLYLATRRIDRPRAAQAAAQARRLAPLTSR